MECPYVSSVLKVLETLFSDEETAKFFYTNDLAVLVEIVLREVLDLHPGKVCRPGRECMNLTNWVYLPPHQSGEGTRTASLMSIRC